MLHLHPHSGQSKYRLFDQAKGKRREEKLSEGYLFGFCFLKPRIFFKQIFQFVCMLAYTSVHICYKDGLNLVQGRRKN